VVIENHPAFIKRWAEIYINKHFKEGPDAAKDYATRMDFSKEVQAKIADYIREKNKRK
jgi:hypothetical protein